VELPDARFAFGENWKRYLRSVDDQRIAAAEASVRRMLATDNLRDKRFLDIGCGSGLFSLAARRLGAAVFSFDYDPQSVGCAQELRRRYAPDDPHWQIAQGSVLDATFLQSLGSFDIVYSWGVLHHTGALQTALANAVLPLVPGGTLAISIYNDQGWRSTYWKSVKKFYQRGASARTLTTIAHAPFLLAPRVVVRAATGRLNLERGMSLWYDLIDWLGGYPFEVATPAEIVAFFRHRGLAIERQNLVGRRMGCNEFVFTKGGVSSRAV